jgi:hypothetical protein
MVAAPFAAIPIVVVIWLWFVVTTRKRPDSKLHNLNKPYLDDLQTNSKGKEEKDQ